VLQGCYELVTSFMETNMAIIAGVTFGIAFSQVRDGILVEQIMCMNPVIGHVYEPCHYLRIENAGRLCFDRRVFIYLLPSH